MGPDHPRIEIYNEAKHGIACRGNIDKMNLSSEDWAGLRRRRRRHLA